jgi:hypothetical protein
MALTTAVIAASAIGAVASTAGNVASTAITNRKNRNLNQMNNEFNAEQAQLNRDFQLEMWNRNNAYNTPTAKRQRMEDAGYSPYADMSGMSVVGGSVPSGDSASASQMPSMQAPDFSNIGQAITQTIDLIYRGKMTDADVSQKNAQTHQIQIDNQTRAAENLARIDNLIKNSKYLNDKSIFQGIQNKYAETAQINARTMETESIKNMQATRQQLYVQTALMCKELNGFDEKRKLELGLLSAQVYSQWQSGQLSFEQAKTELSKRANLDADTGLKNAQTAEQQRATEYNKLEFTQKRAADTLLNIHYQMIKTRNNSSSDSATQWFGRAYNFVGRFGDKIDKKFNLPTWNDIWH